MSLLFNIRKHLHHHPRSSWMLPWFRFWICLHISLVLNKYTQFKSECICGSLWVGWLYHICFCLVINYVWGNTNVKIRTYQLNSHPRFLCYYIPTLSLLFGRSTCIRLCMEFCFTFFINSALELHKDEGRKNIIGKYY